MITRPNMIGMLADLVKNSVLILRLGSAPVDGTSGTGVNLAGPGSLLCDTSAQNWYVNSGTLASPVWQCISEESTVSTSATIATTSTTDIYLIAPDAGILASMDFTSVSALAASDTNFITFTLTNLGQAGAGTTVMLAATAPNTTQVTGGTAITAVAKRALTLSATPANLLVVKGDILRLRATVTGTLAGTVVGAFAMARIRRS